MLEKPLSVLGIRNNSPFPTQSILFYHPNIRPIHNLYLSALCLTYMSTLCHHSIINTIVVFVWWTHKENWRKKKCEWKTQQQQIYRGNGKTFCLLLFFFGRCLCIVKLIKIPLFLLAYGWLVHINGYLLYSSYWSFTWFCFPSFYRQFR